MKKQTRFGRLMALLLALVLILIPGVPAEAAAKSEASGDGKDTITVSYLDVGQGDAAVIQCGGDTMMIDGGKSKESSFIYSWLKKNKISCIDDMIATHPDADHIGGLAGALNYAEVGTAFSPTASGTTRTFKNFVKYLKKQGKSLKVPKSGSEFSLGDAEVKVLGPVSADADDTNNESIVVKITYGDVSFLFTGDAEREEEQAMLDAGEDLKATVLKVGHHGSDSSTSYRFLREVDPEYAVISVGADNSYGHPTENVLSRLRDADVKTYRTDMQGTIIAVSDGKTVTFTTERNADADTLANAGAGQKSGKKQSSTSAAWNSGNSGSTGSSSQAAAAAAQTAAPAVSGTDSSAAQTYVLNINKRKFHYPDCPSVKQMKEENKKIVTENRDEIIDEGYSPCKRCNP